MNDDSFLKLDVSDETKLELCNQKLLQLKEELDWEGCLKKGYLLLRTNKIIQEDFENIDWERRLLLEKMTAVKTPQNQFNNSQVHFGSGDNVGKSKTISKPLRGWHTKWWGQIIIGLVVAVVGGLLFYVFGW